MSDDRLSGRAPAGSGPGSEATGFLYPFIEAEEDDVAGLLQSLVGSARLKMDESRALTGATLDRCRAMISAAARAMAEGFRHGGRLLAFGNGGSATDAEGAVALWRSPPWGRPLPALALVEDPAVTTALANDVGFDLVFSRQVIAHGRPGDTALGFSTSGDSRNVIRAFEQASRRGMVTVGLSGYEGGAMAGLECLDHCLVVRSDSVHRIQEAQSGVVMALWAALQDELAGTPAGSSAVGESQ